MKKIKIKNNRGFTLVETLVAVSIFTISILALMSVLVSGISNTNYVKQKIIASYLAQEGIEYMRNMRDNAVLYDPLNGPNGWTTFKIAIDKCGTHGNPKTCYFDAENLSINACGNGTTPCTVPLKYDSSSGKYNYSFGADSGFIRTIQALYQAGPNDDIKIVSTVSWRQGSGSYSTSLQDDLFNWAE